MNESSQNKLKEVIIAIDAGGTSTKYAVIDGWGEIVYSTVGGSGSPAVNLNAENDIFKGIEEIYQKVETDYLIKAIIIGMSGFALVDANNFFAKLKARFNTEISLNSDAHMALYSILQDKHENGLVVVSGTGAVIIAHNNGKFFMSNGSGELLTERGSAYTSVRDFVKRMIYNNEQLGYFSPLEQRFMKYMNYTKIEDFKMLFYRHHKDEVAKYSKFFIEEADNGDEEAIAWLFFNGELLGIDALSALQRVDMDKEFVMGFRGGFINHASYVIEGFMDVLTNNGYNPMIVEGDNNPIYGGYYLAKRKGFI